MAIGIEKKLSLTLSSLSLVVTEDAVQLTNGRTELPTHSAFSFRFARAFPQLSNFQGDFQRNLSERRILAKQYRINFLGSFVSAKFDRNFLI